MILGHYDLSKAHKPIDGTKSVFSFLGMFVVTIS